MPNLVRITVPTDTQANFEAANPVLLKGEIAFEIDTNRIKIGDGITAYTALSYYSGSEYIPLFTSLSTAFDVSSNALVFNAEEARIALNVENGAVAAGTEGDSFATSHPLAAAAHDAINITADSIIPGEDALDGVLANLYTNKQDTANNVGKLVAASVNVTAGNTVTLDNTVLDAYAVVLYNINAGTGTLTFDPTATGVAAGEVTKIIQLTNISGATVDLAWAHGTVDGSAPSSIENNVTQRFILRTQDTGTTWRIYGEGGGSTAAYDARYVRLSGATMTGALIAYDDPSTALEVATKQFVENLVSGFKVKTEVSCASVANVPLVGVTAMDGYTLLDGDRALLKNQTDTARNGIYDYDLDTNTLTRSADADSWEELQYASVTVRNGTVNKDAQFVCQVGAGGTLNTTPITWAYFGSRIGFTAGSGISLSGGVIAIGSSGVTAGAYGGASAVPVIQVSADGRITSVTATNIAITPAAVSTAGTTIGGVATIDLAGVIASYKKHIDDAASVSGAHAADRITFTPITIGGSSFSDVMAVIASYKKHIDDAASVSSAHAADRISLNSITISGAAQANVQTLASTLKEHIDTLPSHTSGAIMHNATVEGAATTTAEGALNNLSANKMSTAGNIGMTVFSANIAAGVTTQLDKARMDSAAVLSYAITSGTGTATFSVTATGLATGQINKRLRITNSLATPQVLAFTGSGLSLVGKVLTVLAPSSTQAYMLQTHNGGVNWAIYNDPLNIVDVTHIENIVSTPYTPTAAVPAGALILLPSSGASTIVLPAETAQALPTGWNAFIYNRSSAAATISVTSPVSLLSGSTSIQTAQLVWAVKTSSNNWRVFPLSGTSTASVVALATTSEINAATVTEARSFSPALIKAAAQRHSKGLMPVLAHRKAGPRLTTQRPILGICAISPENRYSVLSYSRAYDDEAICDLLTEFLRHGVQFVFIRTNWRSSMVNPADTNNLNYDQIAFHAEYIPGLARWCHWAYQLGMPLGLDFHSLFNHVSPSYNQQWWCPQYIGTWDGVYTGGTVNEFGVPAREYIPAGTYYGGATRPEQRFNPARFVAAVGINWTLQSIWHPEITTARNALGDFEVASLVKLEQHLQTAYGLSGAAARLAMFQIISMLNEPYGDWDIKAANGTTSLPLENGKRQVAVYKYLKDRINTVGWAAPIPKTVRWLYKENPEAANSGNRIDPEAYDVLDEYCMNIYARMDHGDSADIRDAAAWHPNLPHIPPALGVAAAAQARGKDWNISEYYGSELSDHELRLQEYLAFYHNEFLTLFPYSPKRVCAWFADNGGLGADKWSPGPRVLGGQVLAAKGKLAPHFVKFCCGYDPATNTPYQGRGYVPYPTKIYTEDEFDGVKSPSSDDNGPAVILWDRRFWKDGEKTIFQATNNQTLQLYANSFYPGDIVNIENRGAAIVIQRNTGAVLYSGATSTSDVSSATILAGTELAPRTYTFKCINSTTFRLF